MVQCRFNTVAAKAALRPFASHLQSLRDGDRAAAGPAEGEARAVSEKVGPENIFPKAV